jgi:hypothetical protein
MAIQKMRQSFSDINIAKKLQKMKKILCIATLLLGISSGALTQAQAEPAAMRTNGAEHGSVRGVILGNDRSNERGNESTAEAQPKTPAQLHRVLLNCNDGSRHIARVCRRHGGIARDQSAAK